MCLIRTTHHRDPSRALSLCWGAVALDPLRSRRIDHRSPDPLVATFHRDGRPAERPIAHCEVQGYAEEALRRRRAATAAVPPDQGTGVCPTRARAARCCAPDHVTPPSGAMSFNLESLSRRVPRHPSQSIGRFFVVRRPVSGYRILDAPGACSRSSRSERPNGSTCDFRGPRVGPSIAKVGRRG